jgi:prepilin-type N-terminal cleavage/methylation domain-containing protein/prepilin-type processing-associated H-X9-DG protein
MHRPRRHLRSPRGFTLVELLIVIAIIGVLSSLLYPGIIRAKNRAKNVMCITQLSQIGIASITFAGDNNERLPGATGPNTNRYLSPFQSVRQAMRTTRIFVCPSDTARTHGTNMAFLDRTNTSYFISYSATMEEPQSILAGDRNFTYQIPGGPAALVTGNMSLNTSNKFGWYRTIHQNKGNILLADGSAQLTTPALLNTQIAAQPGPTIEWHIPNGDTVFTPP